ncbi:MAG: NAD(+) diphosphatase [Hyphomonadaceae bacterium]|nr:NAD(+) diphosphatase [Hyphomonadaceae bacterium]
MLANPNAFANSPLDRAAHHRRDGAWIAQALERPEARLVVLHRTLVFAIEQDGRRQCGWLAAAARDAVGSDLVIFLGLDRDGAPCFAIEAPADRDAPFTEIGAFVELRMLAMELGGGGDLAILACAKSLIDWHGRHRFCANCGGQSVVSEAGWKRECPACKAEHFPRTDPVVIMVPAIGDKCLLGRQKRFPKGMYSALAGFIEPGESIEEAVARETLEEAGLTVTRVRYHSTQPWPFPSSLMIGALAEVGDDRETIDHYELEGARWFTREEARAMIEGRHPECSCPPAIAIAHQLIKTWAFESQAD